MTRKVIYLTDLDDTLFCSPRKVTGTPGPAVTTATNGHHSHMGPAQRDLFDLMRETGEVIPVTARSSDAFGRVHLEFGTRRAILANGAILLDETGAPDPDWFALTSRVGHAAASRMRDMMATITEEYGDAVRSWIVHESGAPVYLCTKMNEGEPEEIAAVLVEIGVLLFERYGLSDFQQHVNGNNLSLTPWEISKRAACDHLLSRLGDRSDLTVIGVGDSLTDLPFMGLCDFMMTPTRSQIAGRFLPASIREAENV